ncbi:MAG: hypothetical protein DMG71_18480 [Acidobacteria bacterium]|nr:MAG: hypothetical protein DMG71_18480 [Acidobacteriota bacterium]
MHTLVELLLGTVPVLQFIPLFQLLFPSAQDVGLVKVHWPKSGTEQSATTISPLSARRQNSCEVLAVNISNLPALKLMDETLGRRKVK